MEFINKQDYYFVIIYWSLKTDLENPINFPMRKSFRLLSGIRATSS